MELDASGGTYGASATYNTGVGTNAACGAGVFNAGTIVPIKNNIVANLTNSTDIVCSTDVSSATVSATKWAVTAILSGTTGAVCTDSSGNTKLYSAATTVATLTTSMVNAGACI
jgi:hypothetical protein